MELIKLLIILAVVAFGLILLFFPESRVLVTGLLGFFFENIASTPDGAASIYNQKIKDATESYNDALNTHRQAKGQLMSAHDELVSLQEELKQVEKKCENLASRGDKESLMVMAQKRQSIAERIRDLQQAYDKYVELEKNTKEIFDLAQANLEDLKNEKNNTVKRMKDNENIKNLYDQVDRIKGNSASDRLLDSIRDKDKELNEIAMGAQAIHKEKLSTKLQIAEKHSDNLETMDYVNSLLNKYDKKPQPRLRDTKGE